MKKTALVLLVLLCLPCRSFAWDDTALHERLVEIHKDIEAIFSWHVEDRKSLKEVGEETLQGILS